MRHDPYESDRESARKALLVFIAPILLVICSIIFWHLIITLIDMLSGGCGASINGFTFGSKTSCMEQAENRKIIFSNIMTVIILVEVIFAGYWYFIKYRVFN